MKFMEDHTWKEVLLATKTDCVFCECNRFLQNWLAVKVGIVLGALFLKYIGWLRL